MTVLTVLKLGGSVITEKDTPETVDQSTIDRLASTIAASYDGDLVIVHGGGSFGHHHAAAHGVDQSDGTTDATAVRDITGAMARLNDHVCSALADHGLPVVPVHPLSAGRRTADGELVLFSAQIESMIDSGFVPVLHGDVVAHRDRGATILSGDEIVCSLATALTAQRVGLCSAVAGVLDEDGVVPVIDAFDDVAAVLGRSDATDVTGGMAGKVRSLLELESDAYVFGTEGLAGFLDGDHAGTKIGFEP